MQDNETDPWVDEGPERWRYDAKCRDIEWAVTDIDGVKYDIWFPPRDKTKYKDLADAAKAVCFGKDGLPPCPVRVQCLLYAESIDEQHGIWGGLSHRERNALRRKAQSKGMTLEEWVRQ